jgi:hypothetical protein
MFITALLKGSYKKNIQKKQNIKSQILITTIQNTHLKNTYSTVSIAQE